MIHYMLHVQHDTACIVPYSMPNLKKFPVGLAQPLLHLYSCVCIYECTCACVFALCLPATRPFQKACNKWTSFAHFNLLHKQQSSLIYVFMSITTIHHAIQPTNQVIWHKYGYNFHKTKFEGSCYINSHLDQKSQENI